MFTKFWKKDKTNTVIPKQISFCELFKKGDPLTKLQYFIMGSNNIAKKQIPKGLFFLIFEILFFYWLISNGIHAIATLRTLGTKSQGWKLDKNLGIQIQQPGDNSMLLLLFGIASLLAIAIFGYVYWVSFKSNRKLYELAQEGRKIPSTMDDIRSLFDEKFHITLMSIPIVGVLTFTVLPLLYMISIAFTSYDHNHLPPKNLFHWVGFENFGSVINGDIAGTFFPVLTWTIVWAVVATATTFFGGILLALLLNAKQLKGKKYWRIVFMVTMAVPQFVSLLLMANLFNDSGPINALLLNWGWIKSSIPFLTDGTIAKLVIIFVNMWIGIPVTMLIATGIIQNLPQDQIEAATIDGANKIQIFRKITFPQIVFVMAPALIQQFIGNINNFNVIYLLTGGYPSNSTFYSAGETDLLVTWLYKLTVDSADYNLASVIGIIIFVLSAAFSLFAYKKTNSYQNGGLA